MNELYQDGIVLIFTGVVVVMSILIVMALAIRAVTAIDDLYRARMKARQAAPAEAASDKIPNDIVAVIGLALHQFQTEQETPFVDLKVAGGGASAWLGSGRAEIMAGRQRVTSRPR